MDSSKDTFDAVADEQYRRRNYEICTAIDLTKVSCVLDRMVLDGHITKRQAHVLKIQAEAAHEALRFANDKAFGVAGGCYQHGVHE